MITVNAICFVTRRDGSGNFNELLNAILNPALLLSDGNIVEPLRRRPRYLLHNIIQSVLRPTLDDSVHSS